jgi:hypothetical protein
VAGSDDLIVARNGRAVVDLLIVARDVAARLLQVVARNRRADVLVVARNVCAVGDQLVAASDVASSRVLVVTDQR